MRHITLPRVLAVTALLVPASTTVGEDLYFHPADGSGLARTFALDLTIEVADMELTQMGEPVDPSDPDSGFDAEAMGGSWKLEADLTDAIEKAVRGRANKFVRTFGEMLIDGEAMEDSGDLERVAFSWNAEKDAYDLRILDVEEPSDEQREALALVTDDVDHRSFLKDGAVEAGEPWTVELGLEGLATAVLPGFKFDALPALLKASLADEEDQDGVEAMGVLIEELRKSLDGVAAELKLKGVRPDETSGRKIAVCDIEIDFEGTVDLGQVLTDLIRRQSERSGEEGPLPKLELEARISIKGEGEFAWDAEGHHLHHMRLPLELEVVAEGSFAIEIEGLGELEFLAGSVTWEGEANIDQRVTRE